MPEDLAAIPEAELPVIGNDALFLATEDGRVLTDADYAAKFRELYDDGRPLSDALDEPVHLSLRLFQQDKDKVDGTDLKSSKRGHGEIIPILGDLLKDPLEIWLIPQIDRNGKVRLAKRYISVWKGETGQATASHVVLEMLRGVTAFIPRKKNKAQTPDVGYVNRQRTGLLLHRRGQGKPKLK